MFKKGFVLFSLVIVLFSGVNFSDNTIQAHEISILQSMNL